MSNDPLPKVSIRPYPTETKCPECEQLLHLTVLPNTRRAQRIFCVLCGWGLNIEVMIKLHVPEISRTKRAKPQ